MAASRRGGQIVVLRADVGRISRRSAALLVGAAAFSMLPGQSCQANETPNRVYFGGHAFLSKFSDIQTDFPNLHALLLADGRATALDQALVRSGQQGADHRSISVEFQELGRLGPGLDANVLALAFDREVVAASQIGATWKLLVELSFQALVFDFRSKLIRASFPIAIQYLDAFDQEPTPTDIRNALERLVFGDQATGLAATFWATVGAATLPEPGARTLRVSQVSLSEAATTLVSSLGVETPAGLGDQLGYDFGKFLSGNQRLSVLPYAPSQAVDGKMAARLANGSVFNLTLPKADYEISLRLDGLKKVQTATTAAGAAWVYGAFVTIRVVEPLSGRVFFDSQVKLGATRTIPATARNTEDDWPSYAEVLRQLLDEFTRSLTGPDKKWGQAHLVTADANLKPLKELVDSCR